MASYILQQNSDNILQQDGGSLLQQDSTAGASFTLSISATHTTGSQSVTATGSGTTWTGSNPFSVTVGGGFASISGYSNISGTSATFNLSVSALSGTITIADSNSGTDRNITAAAVAPGAPTSVVGTNQGNGSTSVAFATPADNGGAAIISYTVLGSDGYSIVGASSPILVGNNGTGTITYTVRATNSAGAGSASSASSGVSVARTVAAIFYLDNGGDDNDTGRSGHPWSTCVRASAFTFIPDDQLILTSGQSFTGPLNLTNSGTAGHRICIGTGRILPSDAVTTYIPQSSPATISVAATNAIKMTNNQYWSIDNIVIEGPGVNLTTGVTSSTGAGVSIKSTQATNKLLGNSITALTITGTKDGIFAWTPSGEKGQDGLTTIGIDVHSVSRTGIIVTDWDLDNDTGTFGSGDKNQNANIYIKDTLIYDIPAGEGITVRNTTTGLVEYFTIHDLAVNLFGSSGLDTTRADGIVFQYGEVYNVFTPSVDGVGCDFEESENCILQYCYIHDCDGAGYLSGYGASPGMGDYTGNVVRYNIFARNAKVNQTEWYNFGNLVLTSEVHSTTFYGNTVYSDQNDCWTPGTADSAYNNILIAKAGSLCVNGGLGAPAALKGNLYFAIGAGTISVKANTTTYTNISSLRVAGYETHSAVNYGVFGDPLLDDPAGAPSGGTMPDDPVRTVTNFDIDPVSSPALQAGIDFSLLSIDPGDNDFHGYINTVGGDYSIGAVTGLVGATAITLSGPSSGNVSAASTNFTVGADGDTGGIPFSVIVTPTSSAGTGSFSPTTVTISNASPTATFTYTPTSVGARNINCTNDAGLTAPSNVTYTASSTAATALTLSGPSSGTVSVASTNFTVGVNGTITGTIVVTPTSSAGTGSFTPTTVNLTSGSPSATFTYTPTSAGPRNINCTNNGGLSAPSNVTYTVSGGGVGTALLARLMSDGLFSN